MLRDAVGVVPYGHGREGKAAVTNRKILLRTSLIPLTTCVFVGVDAHGDPQSMKQEKNQLTLSENDSFRH